MKEKIGGRVTQRNIADAVGVSHTAVSHVLHRPHQARISSDTQREILHMARQLGYEPRRSTTHTITIVVQPEGLWTDVTINILAAADEFLREKGYRMSVSTLSADNISTAAQLFNQKTVDGVIFTEWYGAKSKCLSSLRVPWLLLADATDVDKKFDQVALDTVVTAQRMTEYLLARGHKRICLAIGEAGIGYHERLKRGVMAALTAANLPASQLIVIHDVKSNSAERALVSLLEEKTPIAIIAGSPGHTTLVLNRLQYHGFRVPEDVSLVSIIDNPRLVLLRPAITASTAVGTKTVQKAVMHLINKIEDPQAAPQQILISGEIIERESVARIHWSSS